MVNELLDHGFKLFVTAQFAQPVDAVLAQFNLWHALQYAEELLWFCEVKRIDAVENYCFLFVS